ncbi:MAG: SAM-dependent chlorinase/fluorinase [Proteobacteria bacterium]|nr:SAM-dependent chlorinase/fluorinase [Desulfobacula sp.]MBU4130700.1 SAM-dependent chlorinase/fluorinase [Pseudomonadota bacterium]
MTAKNPPIVLLTDFGLKDAFVGILKGVILSINPFGNIIDLSHGVRPQDLLHGGFLLSTAMGYFPSDTIFCVVVDPGVGGSRRPILIRTKNYFLVGPDNGVLWQAARKNGIEVVLHLNRTSYFLSPLSSTFHGRDIFAPVAAHLSCGLAMEKLGEPVYDPIPLDLPIPEKKGDRLILTILDIDIYGNITLNISLDELRSFVGNQFWLEAGSARISKIYETYAQAEDRQPFLLAASSGFLEIAVKKGNAAKQLGIGHWNQLVLNR